MFDDDDDINDDNDKEQNLTGGGGVENITYSKCPFGWFTMQI